MIDPYRMVFINIFSIILITLLLLFFKYIYPKKNPPYLLMTILFSLLPIISLLRIGAYESGDFNIHAIRSISFFTSLTEGQLFPNWSRDLNATFGYPTFIIGAPLTYYLNSLFHFLGFSYISSMKIFLAITYVSSGIFMYYWIKSAYGEKSGFISSIFYLYAPFHLIDLHFRVSPGDMLIYSLMPLSAYFIFNVFNKYKFRYLLLGSLSIALIMLSHPMSVAALTFLALYILFLFSQNKQELKGFFLSISIIIFGLLFSAYYWMPILMEKSFIITSIYPGRFIFDDLRLYLFTTWRFGFLYQGPKGEISFLIGYIQILLILISPFIIFKNKIQNKEKNAIYFFITLFLIVFFLFSQFSKPIWDILPFYKNMEFAYRLSLINVLIVSVICGLLLNKIKNKILILILAIAIMQTILNWGHRRVIPSITDTNLRTVLPYSTFQFEGGPAATPKWVDPENRWIKSIPKNNLEILNSKGNFISLKRTSVDHVYIINIKNDSLIKENTYYYPGWNLLIDNEKKEINYKNKKYPGIITFNIKSGIHKIELKFSDTTLRRNAKLISLFSILIFPLYYLLIKIKNN